MPLSLAYTRFPKNRRKSGCPRIHQCRWPIIKDIAVCDRNNIYEEKWKRRLSSGFLGKLYTWFPAYRNCKLPSDIIFVATGDDTDVYLTVENSVCFYAPDYLSLLISRDKEDKLDIPASRKTAELNDPTDAFKISPH